MSRITKSQILKFQLFRKEDKEKPTPKNMAISVIGEMLRQGHKWCSKDFMMNYLAEDKIQSDGEEMMKALEFHLQSRKMLSVDLAR